MQYLIPFAAIKLSDLHVLKTATTDNLCTHRLNSGVLDCLEVDMHSSWGVADGEMLSLHRLLEVARPGHLEVVEKASDENHQLCVSKTAQGVLALSPVCGTSENSLLNTNAHSWTLRESVNMLP